MVIVALLHCLFVWKALFFIYLYGIEYFCFRLDISEVHFGWVFNLDLYILNGASIVNFHFLICFIFSLNLIKLFK